MNGSKQEAGAPGDAGKYPLVSILIPCYNAESWVRQCIESALQQTYTNKEVIVVDDGSTDGSAAIVSAFGDRIIFEHVANAGANAARNRLTRIASGEWLQYLDADDYLLPWKIEAQVELINDRNGEVDVVYSPIIVHELTGNRSDHTTTITGDDEAEHFIRWTGFSSHGVLLRRESVLAVGGWKEDQPCCQEHELLLRMYYKGSRFAAGQAAGAVYRRLGVNSISTRNPLRLIQTRMKLTDQLEAHLNTRGGLRQSHRSALVIARLEAARSAFLWDEKIAEELCDKALATGSRWTGSSPALPWTYRLALSVFGFRSAERLAVRTRKLRKN